MKMENTEFVVDDDDDGRFFEILMRFSGASVNLCVERMLYAQ